MVGLSIIFPIDVCNRSMKDVIAIPENQSETELQNRIQSIDKSLIELHKKILSSEAFKKGSVSIKWLEENIESL